MRRVVVFVCIVSLVSVAIVPMTADESAAINLWGEPCDMAEQFGYQNEMWNWACALHIIEIQACCESGACPSYPCG